MPTKCNACPKLQNIKTHKPPVREEYLTPIIGEDGYEYVFLRDKNNQMQKMAVHMLVAQTFVKNPKNFTKIKHIDGNITNNHHRNLKWVE